MEKPQDLLKKKMPKLESIIKKIWKGIEEVGIKNFNKEYDDSWKKCGFRNNFNKLSLFKPFIFGTKQLTDINLLIFFHKLLL